MTRNNKNRPLWGALVAIVLLVVALAAFLVGGELTPEVAAQGWQPQPGWNLFPWPADWWERNFPAVGVAEDPATGDVYVVSKWAGGIRIWNPDTGTIRDVQAMHNELRVASVGWRDGLLIAGEERLYSHPPGTGRPQVQQCTWRPNRIQGDCPVGRPTDESLHGPVTFVVDARRSDWLWGLLVERDRGSGLTHINQPLHQYWGELDFRFRPEITTPDGQTTYRITSNVVSWPTAHWCAPVSGEHRRPLVACDGVLIEYNNVTSVFDEGPFSTVALGVIDHVDGPDELLVAYYDLGPQRIWTTNIMVVNEEDPSQHVMGLVWSWPELLNIATLEGTEFNIWVGTTDRGVTQINRLSGQWNWHTAGSALPSNAVNAITIDSASRVWVATDQGVAVWVYAEATPLPTPTATPEPPTATATPVGCDGPYPPPGCPTPTPLVPTPTATPVPCGPYPAPACRAYLPILTGGCIPTLLEKCPAPTATEEPIPQPGEPTPPKP